MKKFIPFAMLCFLLQGCVGLVISKTRTTQINDPAVGMYQEVGLAVDELDPSRTNNVYKSNCTLEWLRTSWGAPAHISRVPASSDEVWTYKGDLVWEGVIPFVIIPVPLLVPATKEKVCFSVHDGHVVSARVIQSWLVGGTYGWIPNPEGGGSFGLWNWAESMNIQTNRSN